MIDISDGFFIDLLKITTPKGLGFEVDVSQLPIAENLTEELTLKKSIKYALLGGDDYELCFTIPPHLESQFLDELSSETNLDFSCVGEIKGSNEVLTFGDETYDLPNDMFEHFK